MPSDLRTTNWTNDMAVMRVYGIKKSSLGRKLD